MLTPYTTITTVQSLSLIGALFEEIKRANPSRKVEFVTSYRQLTIKVNYREVFKVEQDVIDDNSWKVKTVDQLEPLIDRHLGYRATERAARFDSTPRRGFTEVPRRFDTSRASMPMERVIESVFDAVFNH